VLGGGDVALRAARPELRELLREDRQLGGEVLPGGLLPVHAHGRAEDPSSGEEAIDDRDPRLEVVPGGQVGVLAADGLPVGAVVLRALGQDREVGVDERELVDVACVAVVPAQPTDELADAGDGVGRDPEPGELDLGEVGRGGLVLAGRAAVGLPLVDREDDAVVPGRQPHEVRVVGLLGDLVDDGEHLDEVLEPVVVPFLAGPPVDEAPGVLLELLAAGGRADRGRAASKGCGQPLPSVLDAHRSSVPRRVLFGGHPCHPTRRPRSGATDRRPNALPVRPEGGDLVPIRSVSCFSSW
jgi:hypothetical protein